MASSVLTEKEVLEVRNVWVQEIGAANTKSIQAVCDSHVLLGRRVEKLKGLLEHVTGEVPR